MTAAPTRENIVELLRQIRDPELERDIVSLGMVKEVAVESGNVEVHLEIAEPQGSLGRILESQVRDKILKSAGGVREVRCKISKPMAAGVGARPAKSSIPGIDHVIAIASGKGGVGKTTVAVNLACALQQMGHSVGLMDGDIYGPNVPLMLGADPDSRPRVTPDGQIAPLEFWGLKMISMGVMVPPDQPMVWRGPMLHNAISQFLQKVDWGKLDYLLIDLPPGTGDVQLSLVQLVALQGAVIVTTPQEVALMDVRKGVAMFRKTGVPILGVIENMTGEVFGRGGGRKAAEQFEVPFLGEIPLDVRVREGGDIGQPIVAAFSETEAAQQLKQAARAMTQAMDGGQAGRG